MRSMYRHLYYTYTWNFLSVLFDLRHLQTIFCSSLPYMNESLSMRSGPVQIGPFLQTPRGLGAPEDEIIC